MVFAAKEWHKTMQVSKCSNQVNQLVCPVPALLKLPNSRMRWPWSMGPLVNACQIVRIQITSTLWHPVSLGGYFIMKLISFRVRSTTRFSSGRATPETSTWILCAPWKMDRFLNCGWTKLKPFLIIAPTATRVVYMCNCTGERGIPEKDRSLAAWLYRGAVKPQQREVLWHPR